MSTAIMKRVTALMVVEFSLSSYVKQCPIITNIYMLWLLVNFYLQVLRDVTAGILTRMFVVIFPPKPTDYQSRARTLSYSAKEGVKRLLQYFTQEYIYIYSRIFLESCTSSRRDITGQYGV